MNATVRDLLASAARAMHDARNPSFMNYEVVDYGVRLDLGSSPGTFTAFWRPHADDGDAFRLAVSRGVRIEFANGWTITYAGSCCAQQFSERHGDDPRAATRLAILRAAAA